MSETITGSIIRYVFEHIESNMYIYTQNNEALVIDPHFSQEAFEYLKGNNVGKVLILLTHEHFDHTSGINWFRENFEVCLVCQQNAISPRSQRLCNRPIAVTIMLMDRGLDSQAEEVEKKYQPYTYTADETFDAELNLTWNGHNIRMESIPGHSPASCLISLDGGIYFTGDSLIPGKVATTRWPGSSTETYYRDTLPKLKLIPESAFVFPGHGTPVEMGRLKYIDNRFEVI